MATTTFGRRGTAPQVASPSLRANAPTLRANAAAAVPDVVLDREPDDLPSAEMIGGRSLVADIPFLTGFLILFLLLIFGVERRLAFDVSKDGELSLESLIAFGAISYDLVVKSGEWWRVSLGPLLHGSGSHLFGNCFALLIVGLRLEPMIGRAWFAMIFVVSALGGAAGSLLFNPPDVPSVGASGAITGLVGALFVVSFCRRAEPAERRAMRRISLFFGVPALLPLAFAASSSVDYFAHAGGAIAGGALGLALCALWAVYGVRPIFARAAAIGALMALAVSMACAGIAATRYSAHGAKAAQFISSSEIPSDLAKIGDDQSARLMARYPKDARSHLFRALFLVVQAHRYAEAEDRLRAAMALASPSPVGRATRDFARTVLAVVIIEQGRRDEAQAMVADICRAKDKDRAAVYKAAMKRILEKAKLCG